MMDRAAWAYHNVSARDYHGFVYGPDLMTNHAIALAFAARFDPPLKVVHTMNINGKPVQDGYMCAKHDDATGMGCTLLVFGDGKVKAFMEYVGGAEQAEAAAEQFVKAFDG